MERVSRIKLVQVVLNTQNLYINSFSENSISIDQVLLNEILVSSAMLKAFHRRAHASQLTTNLQSSAKIVCLLFERLKGSRCANLIPPRGFQRVVVCFY